MLLCMILSFSFTCYLVHVQCDRCQYGVTLVISFFFSGFQLWVAAIRSGRYESDQHILCFFPYIMESLIGDITWFYISVCRRVERVLHLMLFELATSNMPENINCMLTGIFEVASREDLGSTEILLYKRVSFIQKKKVLCSCKYLQLLGQKLLNFDVIGMRWSC